jgi:hypothetical protein
MTKVIIADIARDQASKSKHIENNIVISGIKTTGETENEKQTNDQVNSLAAIKICRPSTTEADIKSTTRIINKAKKDIIIVTLKNNAVKNNIVINAKKLREGEDHENVYINADQTYEQRKIDMERRKLRRNLNNQLATEDGRPCGTDSKGKYDFQIRNGLVLPVYKPK